MLDVIATVGKVQPFTAPTLNGHPPARPNGGPLPAEAVSKRVTSTSGAKVDPPECSVSASRHLGKGKATPENRVISSFDTASANSGR